MLVPNYFLTLRGKDVLIQEGPHRIQSPRCPYSLLASQPLALVVVETTLIQVKLTMDDTQGRPSTLTIDLHGIGSLALVVRETTLIQVKSTIKVLSYVKFAPYFLTMTYYPLSGIGSLAFVVRETNQVTLIVGLTIRDIEESIKPCVRYAISPMLSTTITPNSEGS